MSGKKTLLWTAIATLAVAGMTNVLVSHLHSWQAAAIPFTAVRVITAHDGASGEAESTREEMVAVRADGSSVEIVARTAPDGRLVEQKRIVDVGQRKRVAVDGLTDSLTTYPLSDRAANHYKFKQLVTCMEDDGAEESEMLGFKVERRERRIDDAGTAMRFEEWLAPELNCMIMKRVVRIGRLDGSFPVTSTEVIVSLDRGQPDPSLFALPEGPLVERSPSEVMIEFNRQYARPPNPSSGASVLDQSYHAHRDGS